jgi:hypothetical protein
VIYRREATIQIILLTQSAGWSMAFSGSQNKVFFQPLLAGVEPGREATMIFGGVSW